MHRYRDALIHLSAGDDGITEKSRPIVGAFVLYPGCFDEETGTNPYSAAVHPSGAGERLIEYLYEVESVKLLKRCELTVDQAGSIDPENQNEYWLLKLGPSKHLPVPVKAGGIRKFRYRFTSASDLLSAQRWEDLSERYQCVAD